MGRETHRDVWLNLWNRANMQRDRTTVARRHPAAYRDF
jgi:hypothetical protein